ncbi:hypothetical protein EDC01DRAFT_46673 [Geopyxis carbonaria]|nr:hypothetical protein EDC01DRAFT_46673 [Geopyxis carbonaria]
MGSRGGDTREQLIRYAQFQKDNPGLEVIESVEKFTALVENEASIAQMPRKLGESCTFPARRRLRETENHEISQQSPSRNIHSQPITIPNNNRVPDIGNDYLEHQFIFQTEPEYTSDKDTIDPAFFSDSTQLHINPNYISRSDSFRDGLTQRIPRSYVHASPVEASLSMTLLASPSPEIGAFTPEMSRAASNSSMIGALDMLHVQSSIGAPDNHCQESSTSARFIRPGAEDFQSPTTSKMLRDSSTLFLQRTSESGHTSSTPEIKSTTVPRLSSSSPKRKFEGWQGKNEESPPKKIQSLAPAENTPLERSSSFTKRRAHIPYCRPKHPRVMCRQCPQNKEGFRGEHEFRRHHERIHAPTRKYWVVEDPSGGNFLKKCKSCSSGKKYNADYNATAHLKRQHFNPERNPDVKPPENFRDWIKSINIPREDEFSRANGVGITNETTYDSSGGKYQQKDNNESSLYLTQEEDEGDETDDDDIRTLKGIKPKMPIQNSALRDINSEGRGGPAMLEAAESSFETLNNFRWNNEESLFGINDPHTELYVQAANIDAGNALNIQSYTQNLTHHSSGIKATYTNGSSMLLPNDDELVLANSYLLENECLPPQFATTNWDCSLEFADIR